MRDGENRVRLIFNAKRKMTDNFSPRNEARKGENQLPVQVPVGLENSKISSLSRSFFLFESAFLKLRFWHQLVAKQA